WFVYTGLTVTLWALLCGLADLDWYEGLTHSLTTIAAGGFSPNPQSLAGYQNPVAEWVLCPFMLLAGASFSLQYRAVTGRPGALFFDGEFLLYSLVTLSVSAGLVLAMPAMALDDA